MQRMALDPLAQIDQPPQQPHGGVHRNAENALQGMHGAHLVGDGTNPANARDDVRDFQVMPPAQEGFEQPRRLKDLELHVLHLVALELDRDSRLAFHAREVVHLYAAAVAGCRLGAHDFSHSSPAWRNCQAQAL